MFFTFEFSTTDPTDPTGASRLDVPCMVILHGLRPGNSKWLSITINGDDRFGRWDAEKEELILDRGIVLTFDQHVMRLIDRFTTEDLPPAASAAIEALANAGPECAIEMCDLCGMFVPFRCIEVRSVCLCVRCKKKFQKRTDPGDQGPAF
jgi:hypothetical protein